MNKRTDFKHITRIILVLFIGTSSAQTVTTESLLRDMIDRDKICLLYTSPSPRDA